MYIKIKSTGAWDYNNSTKGNHFDEPLAENLNTLLNNNTLLDFGCGLGKYINYIQTRNPDIKTIGIEPFVSESQRLVANCIVTQDLTETFDLGVKGNVMCLEVLEHIPQQFEDIAVDNIVRHCNDWLVISWAVPKQSGHGHVNCKSLEDVVNLFESKGFVFQQHLSVKIRKQARLWWFRNNVCVFRYKDSITTDVLFDVDSLPQLQTPLIGYVRATNRRIMLVELEQKMICTKVYQQFVTNNIEYLILPLQTFELTQDILLKNNFSTVARNTQGDQSAYFAYRPTNLSNTYKYTHNIVMCVYFLNNTVEEIKRFFDYYSNQGVDRIFMYYCGKLTERPNLPQRSFVEYHEWGFINRVKDLTTRLKKHYAQPQLYNMFAKKIGIHCNWSIYVDLDEYIYHPSHTLKEYLADKQTCLFTDHRFSIVDPITKICMHESITSFPGKGKTILKGSEIKIIDAMYVHRSCRAKNCDLLLLHNRTTEGHIIKDATVNLSKYLSE